MQKMPSTFYANVEDKNPLVLALHKKASVAKFRKCSSVLEQDCLPVESLEDWRQLNKVDNINLGIVE